MSSGKPDTPELEYSFTLAVDIAEAETIETRSAEREIIPIVGGTVSGEIDGEVLPAGADYAVVGESNDVEVMARYAFETDEGDRVYVENPGIARFPSGDHETAEYFRTKPEFETAASELRWLEESVFVGSAAVHADYVEIDVYRVR